MRGHILEYRFGDRAGLISGEDGNRYAFTDADWRGEAAPGRGQAVDFDAQADAARDIFPQVAAVAASSGPMKPSLRDGIIAAVAAATAYFIPVIGLIGAVVAIVFGLRARRAAAIDGDPNAPILGLVAIIAGAIGLVVALISAFAFLAAAVGIGIMGGAAGL